MAVILLGKGESPVYLHAKYGNRHGLVAGATGTGKTVTLRVLAEGFSWIGVPVILADVKGDLAGRGRPGAGRKREDRDPARPRRRLLADRCPRVPRRREGRPRRPRAARAGGSEAH